MKNNENDTVFDEIYQKNSKIKIKFQKMKGTFCGFTPESRNTKSRQKKTLTAKIPTAQNPDKKKNPDI